MSSEGNSILDDLTKAPKKKTIPLDTIGGQALRHGEETRHKFQKTRLAERLQEARSQIDMDKITFSDY